MMLSIAQALQIGTEQCVIADDPFADAKIDAQCLLCAVLDCNRAYLHTWPDKVLSSTQQTEFLNFIEQRQTGKPIAYILGYQNFYGYDFAVSPATLIPRPETEQCVDLVIAKPHIKRVLDLGTGTGAIALSIILQRPELEVLGVDFVPEAVTLAQQNAQNLAPKSNISFKQSNWFSHVDGRFDVIVSNPPYVEPDSPYLAKGDIRFEPNSALTAAQNGLADIILIVSEAKHYLNEHGLVILEHGHTQGTEIRQLMTQNGFTNVTTLCDYAGQPRITLGEHGTSSNHL